MALLALLSLFFTFLDIFLHLLGFAVEVNFVGGHAGNFAGLNSKDRHFLMASARITAIRGIVFLARCGRRAAKRFHPFPVPAPQ